MKKRVELLRASWPGFLAVAITLASAAPALADENPGPAIPEPASYLVFLAGALGVAWVVRSRHR